MQSNIVIFVLALMLLSCGDQISDRQKLAAIEKNKTILAYTCEINSSQNTPYGELQNKSSNAVTELKFESTQCLAMRTLDANTQYGWYWQWPVEGEVILAQPRITLGNNPLESHNNSKMGYPLSISELSKLNIDYSVDIVTDGELNLLTTFWLTHANKIQLVADTSSIAATVTMSSYITEDFEQEPQGENIAEFAIEGVEWQVWLENKQSDNAKNSWINLSFQSSQSYSNLKFDALKLLTYAIEDGIIPESLYIADVQLGTQIINGTGQLWIERFQIEPVASNL